MSGLPGTGKTTLARRLSKELFLVYLRVDCIEVPFSTYNSNAGAKGEGYHAIINIAEENLKIGHSVIIDIVNPLHLSRAMFKALSEKLNVKTYQFEIKLKDKLLHKKRVEERKPDILNHKMPTWQDVLNHEYEEWNEPKDGPTTVIWTDDSEQAFFSCLKSIQGV